MTSTNSFLSLEESSSQVFTDFLHFAIIFQPFLPIVPGHLCVLPAARCQCPHCLSRMGQKTESAPHKGWASARAENAKGNCRAAWDAALPLATSTNLQHPAATQPRCRSRDASWPASGRYAAPGDLPHLPKSRTQDALQFSHRRAVLPAAPQAVHLLSKLRSAVFNPRCGHAPEQGKNCLFCCRPRRGVGCPW